MQVLPVGVAVSQDPGEHRRHANLALSELLGVEPGENIRTRIDLQALVPFVSIRKAGVSRA